MKINLFLLISILMVILSCQDVKFKSEGKWIGIYSLLDEPSKLKEYQKEFIHDTTQLKKILSFEEDSMVLSIFNETLYYGFNQYKIKFKLEKDSIKFNYEEKETTIEYSYKNGLLFIDFMREAQVKYKDYFIQIDEYGMSHKEKEISSFLTSNPIVIGQRKEKLELFPPHWDYMAKFIQDSLEVDYLYGNDWYFYSNEKELFLIIADYIIHITGFKNNKIYGLIYDKKLTEIEIRTSSYHQKYDYELLLGNWLEVSENEIGGKEMIITDENIIVNSQTYSDTLEWYLNKYGNKILIERDYFRKHGEFWKIQLLSNTEFVLKRKIEVNRESQIELLTFIKE